MHRVDLVAARWLRGSADVSMSSDGAGVGGTDERVVLAKRSARADGGGVSSLLHIDDCP